MDDNHENNNKDFLEFKFDKFENKIINKGNDSLEKLP